AGRVSPGAGAPCLPRDGGHPERRRVLQHACPRSLASHRDHATPDARRRLATRLGAQDPGRDHDDRRARAPPRFPVARHLDARALRRDVRRGGLLRVSGGGRTMGPAARPRAPRGGPRGAGARTPGGDPLRELAPAAGARTRVGAGRSRRVCRSPFGATVARGCPRLLGRGPGPRAAGMAPAPSRRARTAPVRSQPRRDGTGPDRSSHRPLRQTRPGMSVSVPMAFRTGRHALLALAFALGCKPTIAEPALADRIDVHYPAEHVAFAVLGDYGSAGAAAAAVAELVHGWNPDIVITLGDNNYPNGRRATIDANVGQYYHRYISPYVGKYGPGASEN